MRIADNTALIRACTASNEVLPVFIFDPRQIKDHPYRSESGLLFMLESLRDLQMQFKEQGGRLVLLWAEPDLEVLLQNLIVEQKIEAIFINADYTPFAKRRDESLEKVCEKSQIKFHKFDDALLNSPKSIKKGDGSPYVVYSAYYKAASKTAPVPVPVYKKFSNWYQAKVRYEIDFEDSRLKFDFQFSNRISGGRANALKILKGIDSFKEYAQTRDFPALNSTSRLSAHHKFGTVSVREVYHLVAKRFGSDHTFIRELYWRDFFTQIGFNFPHVYQGAFHKNYDRVEWESNPAALEAWQSGLTGFPIVDAGMRELNQTGFMHNRVRMIVASFLTKDLHISWREGERYFARKLVDYDPAVNNGNWQWAASTGCDAQPYFRIFNPWLQQKKFDSECKYIKIWIPELRNISCSAIHDPESMPSRCKDGYPKPIVEHDLERDRALDYYSVVKDPTKTKQS